MPRQGAVAERPAAPDADAAAPAAAAPATAAASASASAASSGSCPAVPAVPVAPPVSSSLLPSAVPSPSSSSSLSVCVSVSVPVAPDLPSTPPSLARSSVGSRASLGSTPSPTSSVHSALSAHSAVSGAPGHSRRDSSSDLAIKSKLLSHVENRPDKESLLRKGIIKSGSLRSDVDPKLHGVMSSLIKQRQEENLARVLRQRPTQKELVHQRIMLDTSKSSVSVQLTQRALLKRIERDRLSQFLTKRPTLDELVRSHTRLMEDTMTWTRITQQTGAIPLPRTCHTINHFPHSPRLYLLGGYGPGTTANMELLIFDSSCDAWTRPSVGGPTPRERYSHTTSSVGSGKLLVFGGFVDGTWKNEVYVLDTQVAQPFEAKITHAQPQQQHQGSQQQSPALKPHTAASLPPTHVTSPTGSAAAAAASALTGGERPRSSLSSRSPSFSPQPLTSSSSHASSPGHTGSHSGSSTVHMLMWQQPAISGTPPKPRAAHTACVLSDDRVLIFGGNDGGELFNDLHVLDTRTWTWLQPSTTGTPPAARAGHSMSVLHNRFVVVFGGAILAKAADGSVTNRPMNDLYVLDTAQPVWIWSKPVLQGTPPSARAGHAAASFLSNQLLVFGGGFESKTLNDLHVFNFDTLVWSRPADTGTVPSPRAGHTANVLGSRIFTFGGHDEEPFNDLHTLDTAFLRVQQAYHYQALEQQAQAAAAAAAAQQPHDVLADLSLSALSLAASGGVATRGPGASHRPLKSQSAPSSPSGALSRDRERDSTASGARRLRGMQSVFGRAVQGELDLSTLREGTSAHSKEGASSPSNSAGSSGEGDNAATTINPSALLPPGHAHNASSSALSGLSQHSSFDFSTLSVGAGVAAAAKILQDHERERAEADAALLARLEASRAKVGAMLGSVWSQLAQAAEQRAAQEQQLLQSLLLHQHQQSAQIKDALNAVHQAVEAEMFAMRIMVQSRTSGNSATTEQQHNLAYAALHSRADSETSGQPASSPTSAGGSTVFAALSGHNAPSSPLSPTLGHSHSNSAQMSLPRSNTGDAATLLSQSPYAQANYNSTPAGSGLGSFSSSLLSASAPPSSTGNFQPFLEQQQRQAQQDMAVYSLFGSHALATQPTQRYLQQPAYPLHPPPTHQYDLAPYSSSFSHGHGLVIGPPFGSGSFHGEPMHYRGQSSPQTDLQPQPQPQQPQGEFHGPSHQPPKSHRGSFTQQQQQVQQQQQGQSAETPKKPNRAARAAASAAAAAAAAAASASAIASVSPPGAPPSAPLSVHGSPGRVSKAPLTASAAGSTAASASVPHSAAASFLLDPDLCSGSLVPPPSDDGVVAPRKVRKRAQKKQPHKLTEEALAGVALISSNTHSEAATPVLRPAHAPHDAMASMDSGPVLATDKQRQKTAAKARGSSDAAAGGAAGAWSVPGALSYSAAAGATDKS